MKKEKDARYIPALNQSWLTPLYDPLMRLVMREQVFKQRLVDLVGLQPGESALDLGCGTGTLTLMLHQSQPGAAVTGLDGDEAVLDAARRKAGRAGLPGVRWDRGLSYRLPYPAGAFDAAAASLMVHHLAPPDRHATFAEVRRVLKPGGRFFIADFGAPHGRLMRLIAALMSHFERSADHFNGGIPGLLAQAGFADVEEADHFRTVFGSLSIYRAVRGFE